MGITRIANVTGLDRIGVPVVMVCRPNSRSLAVSQGKGLTLDAAKASGVMEAIELYHAERIQLPLKLGSARELAESHRLIDLEALPQRADSRFHPDLPIALDRRARSPHRRADLGSLRGRPHQLHPAAADRQRLLPRQQQRSRIRQSPASKRSTMGSARWSSATRSPCGIIWTGRDASARASISRTVDDDDCAEVLERLERAGFAVAVWDTTTDVGIASFYCLITDRRHENAHSGAGAGAHPARAIALLRALTEAIQVRTTYITGSRDDLRPDEFTAPALEQKLRRARGLMAGPAAPRDFRRRAEAMRPQPAPTTSTGCWAACAPSASRRSSRSI